MFGWLFKNRKRAASVTPKMAMSELAMRASIADKLRNYRADEDTTISKFTLADDEAERKREMKLTQIKTRDAWGQANPGETGKWNKEDRLTKVRTNSGGLR